MPRFLRITTAIIVALIGVVALAIPLGRVSVPSGAAVNDTLVDMLENDDHANASVAAEKVYIAESSRQQVIQDSIDASVAESVSIRESIEESVAESRSIEESIEESIRESVEESILASLEESEAESRLAEERARQASIQASLAESRAAEERRLQEEAARWAAEHPGQVSGGLTLLFGDSRTSGFSAYHVYPDAQVLWDYNQITSAKNQSNLARAAMMVPEKIIFLNGVDDLISFGLTGARDQYENAIRSFASRSPGTKIYVGSVLPCRMDCAGAAKYPILAQTENYNALLMDMCARNGWTYVNSTAGFSYAFAFGSTGGDGIHFTAGWTQQWLNNLRAQAGF